MQRSIFHQSPCSFPKYVPNMRLLAVILVVVIKALQPIHRSWSSGCSSSNHPDPLIRSFNFGIRAAIPCLLQQNLFNAFGVFPPVFLQLAFNIIRAEQKALFACIIWRFILTTSWLSMFSQQKKLSIFSKFINRYVLSGARNLSRLRHDFRLVFINSQTNFACCFVEVYKYLLY